jgi:sortase (surface protein transpeptidase)
MTPGAGRPRVVARHLAGVAVAVVAGLMLGGCAGVGHYTPAAATRPSASPTRSPAGPPPAAAGEAERFRSPRTAAAFPVPVRVRIPSIHVDAPLEHVGLDPDGTIAAPEHPLDAAWYTGGPLPGQPGPAVLLGHVDYDTKKAAVFFLLATLKPGAEVLVDRADRTTVRFRVSGRIQVAKSRFPADLVFGPTLAPSLRLVTCGGDFDRSSRHYLDNVVVSAVAEVSSP